MLRRGENVRATVIGSDETKSPLLVEHLNFARRHASLLGFKIAGDFRADPALFCNRSSQSGPATTMPGIPPGPPTGPMLRRSGALGVPPPPAPRLVPRSKTHSTI